MTLEQLLANEQAGVLLNIQRELAEAIVPATGYAHEYCRKVNRMIDKGELCINPTTYRKVYLPTLSKAVHKELARRWTEVKMKEANEPGALDYLARYVQLTHPELDADMLGGLIYQIDHMLEEAIEAHLDGEDISEEAEY